jgi:hypothetical protein
MSSDTETTAADLGFEPPTKHALAQAFCLVTCAERQWGGCTFDGHSCDDRYGDTIMRQAWKALVTLADKCQEQPHD